MALAGLGLLLVGGPARAQQGWPLAGDNWSFYGGGRSSRSSFAESTPSYDAPSYATYYAPPASGGYYGSLSSEGYYGTLPTEAFTNLPVRVNLWVPADAKIWFNGSQTHQTGTARSFESPPLAPGQEYAYEIRVQWKRDGKDITQTKQLDVRAGDVINLALGSSS